MVALLNAVMKIPVFDCLFSCLSVCLSKLVWDFIVWLSGCNNWLLLEGLIADDIFWPLDEQLVHLGNWSERWFSKTGSVRGQTSSRTRLSVWEGTGWAVAGGNSCLNSSALLWNLWVFEQKHLRSFCLPDFSRLWSHLSTKDFCSYFSWFSNCFG